MACTGEGLSVKHGSAYRRRAGDGVSKTGTDKPSRKSQAGAREHRTRNGIFARLAGAVV
ncbi:MAG: hypothetical protein ACYSN7_02660 [Planctomycetota bacterium]|jgi:hypothetical protein